jgi:hypothetical protein
MNAQSAAPNLRQRLIPPFAMSRDVIRRFPHSLLDELDKATGSMSVLSFDDVVTGIHRLGSATSGSDASLQHSRPSRSIAFSASSSRVLVYGWVQEHALRPVQMRHTITCTYKGGLFLDIPTTLTTG